MEVYVRISGATIIAVSKVTDYSLQYICVGSVEIVIILNFCITQQEQQVAPLQVLHVCWLKVA